MLLTYSSHYNFNKLILLIGINPLPDFVVAEYFLRNNPSLKEIILLYSEEKNISTWN